VRVWVITRARLGLKVKGWLLTDGCKILHFYCYVISCMLARWGLQHGTAEASCNGRVQLAK